MKNTFGFTTADLQHFAENATCNLCEYFMTLTNESTQGYCRKKGQRVYKTDVRFPDCWCSPIISAETRKEIMSDREMRLQHLADEELEDLARHYIRIKPILDYTPQAEQKQLFK